MDLGKVVSKLQEFARTSLAAEWDNVGLLVEPTAPHVVKRIILTNDLTSSVAEEAISADANMIISYHPPIFVPMKRLTQSSWKERIIVKCIENKIAIYSPHTSFDAIDGGINDWLISPFVGEVEPLQLAYKMNGGHKVDVSLGKDFVSSVFSDISKMVSVKLMKHDLEGGVYRCSFHCSGSNGLIKLLSSLESQGCLKYDQIQITHLDKVPSLKEGAGRLVKLNTPISLNEVVEKVKSHLGLSHVRLAVGCNQSSDFKIKKLAVCAGSGSSVLSGVSADLYITGEMSHHEVLDATEKKRSVILCDHSNTERGYLESVLKSKLETILENQVEIIISEKDHDPLNVV